MASVDGSFPYLLIGLPVLFTCETTYVRSTVVLLLRMLTPLLVLVHASAQTQTAATTHEQAQQACERLKGLTVPAESIALPTAGALVTHAQLAHTKGVEYCKLLGEIRPVTPDTQNIRFEANLPTRWNGKAVQFGGAIFDGWLAYSKGLKQPTIGPKGVPTPLQRGYLTFGSDSGHHKRHFFLPSVINLLDASFGTNPQERKNFTQDALKETRDAVINIAQTRYGQAPARIFFLGSSTGGHEALMVAQHWPNDYDGVLSGYPPWDGVELILQFIRTSQALYTKGGFLPRSTTKLLTRSVLKRCDGMDGVVDGVVSNVSACHFDPASLLCDTDPERGCLKPQQLLTVQTFATEQRTAQPVWGGVQSISGYNVLSGADLTGTLGWFHHGERHPKILLNSLQYTIGGRVVQSFLAEDKHFNALGLNTSTGEPYADKLLGSSRDYDASPDLSRFAAHGGKLLLVHGTTDTIIPTNSSIMYYDRLRAAMGEATVQQFMRLYLIPGFGHGEGRFKAGFDALAMLDHWVATGLPDANPTVQDKNRSGHGRTRPLCAYPSWPRYSGTGDENLSSSFVCSKD